MKSANIAKNNYKQTIVDFTKGQKQFLLVQKSGIALGFILIVASLPVMSKVLGDKDIFVLGSNVWLWSIPVMAVFLFFFSRWGYKCYKSITTSAGNVLKELESEE